MLLLSVFFLPYPNQLFSQQPNVPLIAKPLQPMAAIYVLKIIPVAEGKTYTIIDKSKVVLTFKNGTSVSGKVKGVSKDSINIDYRNFSVKDIDELKYNPGTALGAAAAIVTTLGVAAIAFTADGGKDKERDGTEDAIFYAGIGMAVIGGITLIPTYFVKKRFSSHQYDFVTLIYGS